MHEIDLDRAHRETARWRILRILEAGRPVGVSEVVILRALSDAELPVTAAQLRKEMDYLQRLGLIEIDGRDGPVWAASLTAQGIDVVEYTLPTPDGIGRPKKWW